MSERESPAVVDATLRATDSAPAVLTEVGLEQIRLTDESRYDAVAMIGEGGMGEVRLCRDRRIGREVAMKLIHRGQGSVGAHARFVREACVQGQLEHPAVAPVYDLAIGPDGPFFTMKRIRGLALDEVIAALRDGDPEATKAYALRRLLTAMSTVCLAVAFAHARGVLHRDLKPSNVMLGAFGEIYVLDWGVAKLMSTPEAGDGAGITVATGDSGKTRVGDIIGTPGHMAPEQALGEASKVDERSEVYALGAILFELVTLEHLHEGETFQAIMASTLGGVDVMARMRACGRAYPAGLDTLIAKATALAPEDRHASARELAEAIDAILDGAQNDERRRKIADGHAEKATTAADRALSSGDDEARSEAMREAGAALALDPVHPVALATLARLLLSRPAVIPVEARAEFEARAQVVQRSSATTLVVQYVAWLGFVPVILWLGVRDWLFFAVGVASMVGAALAAALAYRLRAGAGAKFVVYLLGTAVVVAASTVLGPLILAPNLALTNALAFVLYGDREYRAPAIAVALAGLALPLALQVTGVIPASYTFTSGGMLVESQMVAFPPQATLTLLFFASVLLVLAPTVYAGRIRDAVRAAEERAFLHAWSLRQLLPEKARKVAADEG